MANTPPKIGKYPQKKPAKETRKRHPQKKVSYKNGTSCKKMSKFYLARAELSDFKKITFVFVV